MYSGARASAVVGLFSASLTPLRAGRRQRFERERQSTARRRLAERRLVEAAQLSRMQGRTLAPEDIERRQADHEVLAYRALVEGIGRARQLDLAMERLVR